MASSVWKLGYATSFGSTWPQRSSSRYTHLSLSKVVLVTVFFVSVPNQPLFLQPVHLSPARRSVPSPSICPKLLLTSLTVGSHCQLSLSALIDNSHCRLSLLLLTVGSHCRFSVLVLIVGSHCRLSLTALIDRSQCRFSLTSLNVGSHFQLSLFVLTVRSH